LDELPLKFATPQGWARTAAADLPTFLADHAVCEQQAALFGLNLIAHYPNDAELVDCMSALATEEAMHLRRVAQILHRRGMRIGKRRPNGYAQALHQRIIKEDERRLKEDRLFVGALIEARSCECFTRLLFELQERG
jgi:tRNA-(ms[2]io[6]A)-hydroxylase